MKPNFLVIGAPKAATTSLCHQLGQHPEVFFSKPKETFFFCYDQVYEKKGWAWFESLFDQASGYRAIGEGSTINANLGTYPDALPRIAEHLPEAKIIYIVREPIQRMESYWIELHSQGTITIPFNRAVREDPQLIDTSLYWKQLSAYREHFSDDKILLLFFEDFKRDAHDVLRRCFEFLGVDPSVTIQGADQPRYVSEGKRSDMAVTNLMRKLVPGFYSIRDAMPRPIREGAKKLLKKPIEGRPDWDPAVLAWAVEQVRADSAAFLDFCGKPADYWDLAKYNRPNSRRGRPALTMNDQGTQLNKPRVLLIAEACNPDWVSVPLVGWSHFDALRRVAEVHLLTHPRNREAIQKRGLVEGRDFTLIDNEHVAGPMYRAATLLRGGKGKGWTTVTALGWPAYWEFERLVWKRFGPAIRRGDYDIVHRLTPLTPTMPSRLATRCKQASVPFVLGPLNGGVPWPKGFDDRRRAENEWLSYIRSAFTLLPGYRSTRRDAAAIIVASRDTLAQMPDACKDRCIYIPENGIDPERFSLVRDRSAELPMRCVFLGRLVPYKGADLLIKAAAPAMKRGQVTLKIVGDGPQRDDLVGLIQELGVGGSVELCGWVEHTQVQQVLADSDFMAVPSIREFGGGVVLEAMALGLPAVVVDYGGPADLVTDTTGVRVPIGPPDAIVDGFRRAIERFAADPALIDRFGLAAKARVDALFTWSAKAGQTLSVYRWLMGRGAKPAFAIPFPDHGRLADAPSPAALPKPDTEEAIHG